MNASKIRTRYFKTTNVNGETKFELQEYTTSKLTRMHERIRNHYPAETAIGSVMNAGEGKVPFWFGLFVIERHIASKDWEWAREQNSKQIKAKRLQAAKVQ